MKTLSLIFMMLVLGVSASVAQSSLGLNKYSLWDDKDFTVSDPDQKYSSIWGWYNDKGNEYGIFGSRNYTYIVDITDPANPVLKLKEPGRAQDVIWREYKTYKNYAYGVNDGTDGSLQVFDMSKLPDSVTKVYDSDEFITQGHTLFIDEKGRLFIFGNTNKNGNSATMVILDVATNPAKPKFLKSYNNVDAPNVHDGFVKNDKVFAFSSYDGLYIYDVADLNNITIINSITSYPGSGYCHSGWLTDDEKYLVVADEVPVHLPLKIFDVSDLSNIQFIDTFRSTAGSTPHNTFIKDRLLYVSYYGDGVQVFDISDPANVERVAYYDTYPDDNSKFDNYHGCWGVYPYFPSGNIIASDRKYGMYTLTTKTVGINDNSLEKLGFSIGPNPFGDQLKVNLALVKREEVLFNLLDIQGRVLYSESKSMEAGNNELDIRMQSKLDAGIYLIKINIGSEQWIRKLVKSN